jgi:hypothetical protein
MDPKSCERVGHKGSGVRAKVERCNIRTSLNPVENHQGISNNDIQEKVCDIEARKETG